MNHNTGPFHAIFDSMHTAILLLDEHLHFVNLNPSAEALLRISARRFNGSPVQNVITEYGHIPEGLLKAKQNNQRFTKRKSNLLINFVEKIVVDYTITPIIEDGLYLLMEIAPLDRALQISKEEMLVSSQAVVQHMVRGLAHEIKNPLGGIRGAAQLLERELNDSATDEFTRIIISEADRLRNLVDRLLGPNKKSTPKLLNIHEVLGYVHKLISVEASSEGIMIKRDYDPSIPEIMADREQLLQVFLNIIRNAVQVLAKRADAKVTLKTRIQRKFTIGNIQHNIILRVDIIDNGPGIDDELAEKLFFPMVSGRAEGTGLGLSIAQTIINRHQGLIKFQREDNCTLFSIYLPFGDKA